MKLLQILKLLLIPTSRAQEYYVLNDEWDTMTWTNGGCFPDDLHCEPFHSQYHTPTIPDNFSWYIYGNGTLDFDTDESSYMLEADSDFDFEPNSDYE